MKIERFEDIDCWKKAREYVNYIYLLSRKPKFNKDLRLVGQITSAAVSIMNNIVEGWASQSNPEFIKFLKYSRRSCLESQNCLYVALDQKYIDPFEFDKGFNLGIREIMMIDGFLRYLRSYQHEQKKSSQR
jgi:four helix bundle protein